MRREVRRSAFALLALTWSPTLPAGADVGAVDDRGVSVVLSRPANRIVALAPHAAELVFAAGAGGKLVGTVHWSDHPDAVRHVPRIGDSARLDMEAIARLKPDLAVGWVSGNRVADLARLERMGVRVFATEPRRVDAIPAVVARIGRLAGTETRADELLLRLRELEATQADKPRLRVFYEIWHTPPMTVGGNHFISDALRRCGADNAFADFSALAGTVTVESVLARRPDVIAVADREAGIRWADTFRKAGLAIKLVSIDPDSLQRPGPRLISGNAALCRALDQARQNTSAIP